jgi:hypothetical protein
MSGLLLYDKPVDGTILLTEAYRRYRARVLPVQQPAAAVERLIGELRAELAEASFGEKPTHEQTLQERAKAGQEAKERRLAIASRRMESLREAAEVDEHAKKEREAIETFRQALEKGEVTPLVPRTGTGFYWHLAEGWERDFTISLFLFPEAIDKEEHPYWEKAHRERPFVEEAAFEAWLGKQQAELQQKQTIAAEHKCQNWLESEMRASPDRRPKNKESFREEAIGRFNVSGRGFDRAWDNAISATAVAWGRGGRPRKL